MPGSASPSTIRQLSHTRAALPPLPSQASSWNLKSTASRVGTWFPTSCIGLGRNEHPTIGRSTEHPAALANVVRIDEVSMQFTRWGGEGGLASTDRKRPQSN